MPIGVCASRANSVAYRMRVPESRAGFPILVSKSAHPQIRGVGGAAVESLNKHYFNIDTTANYQAITGFMSPK